ncbi:MAG: 4-alpha-glucanotransferase [Clostridia bacterium]|nr:4-alpha-glucanotransferase [Clostridia bacterium]
MKRESGILVPVFSLPSKYGAGGFGQESYDFIDYISDAKIKVWQILPLAQTGYGDSPYSSVSVGSINPYFISLEKLQKERLLKKVELEIAKNNDKYIDYGFLFNTRYPLLKKAFDRFDKNDKSFKAFVRSKRAYDYALFMSIRETNDNKPFYEWEEPLKRRAPYALKQFVRENKERVLFWQFVQYIARKQWFELKAYANSKSVKILGDMPLYVALDSVEVWKNPELYKLNENFYPEKVAGVPPDYFSKEGQLWGNPVYDYARHKEDNFFWWKNRLKRVLRTFDLVRIDHFRGLDRYYEVDADAKNAMVGEWIEVPSKELFDEVHKEISSKRIIAEDLGIIDDGVRELLAYTGYPGMKILSFAFDDKPDNLYLPENIEENSVCYTGTHDNDTLMGLLNGASEWDLNNFRKGVKSSLKKFKIRGNLKTPKGIAKSIIKLGFACKSNLFIIPMQDALLFDTDYRINEPGTVKNQNWSVRFKKRDFRKSVKNILQNYINRYAR